MPEERHSLDRKEQAEQNLKFIEELRKSAAFNQYFTPRLRAKQLAHQVSVMTDKELTADEREIRRRIWVEYEEEILKLLDVEAGAEKSILKG